VTPPRIDPVAIDVAGLLDRSLATLHSCLVTRPTGEAVRLAIEGQLPAGGRGALSVVDLSRVLLLDFSCADEVVAKLLLRYLAEPRPRDAWFLFRGVGEGHRDPIEAVLERRGLAAVMQDPHGATGLIGVCGADEEEVWGMVEAEGHLMAEEVEQLLPSRAGRDVLERLVLRRLVLVSHSGGVHALSRLAPPPLPVGEPLP